MSYRVVSEGANATSPFRVETITNGAKSSGGVLTSLPSPSDSVFTCLPSESESATQTSPPRIANNALSELTTGGPATRPGSCFFHSRSPFLCERK